MTAFVLVHGANCGGWQWQRVARLLQSAGHVACYPSLDGCGERKGAVRPEITLDTHGEEIAQLLFYEDLREVVLVGTSRGGMVVARAAELASERIARLVFIDAVVPQPGETLSVALTGKQAPATALQLVVKPSRDRADQLPELEPADAAWVVERFTGHPSRTGHDPVDLRTFWSRRWPSDVLYCRQSKIPGEAHQRRIAAKLGASWTELDAGHYPMITHPGAIAEYLQSRGR